MKLVIRNKVIFDIDMVGVMMFVLGAVYLIDAIFTDNQLNKVTSAVWLVGSILYNNNKSCSDT